MIPDCQTVELKTLNSKLDRMKVALKRQLNSKVDSLRDSLEKLVIENRDCLKAELVQKLRKFKITWIWRSMWWQELKKWKLRLIG